MKKNTLILISLLCLPFSAQAVIWSGTAGQNIIPLAVAEGQTIVTSTGLGSLVATIPQQNIEPAVDEIIATNLGMEAVTSEDWIDFHAPSTRWVRKKRTRISSAASGALLLKTPYVTMPQAHITPPALNFSGQGVASSGGNNYFIQSLATDKFTTSGLTLQPVHQAIRIQVIDLTSQTVVTQKTFQDNATWTLKLGECFVTNIDDPTLNTDDDLVIVRERTAPNGNIVKQHLVYSLTTGTLVRTFSTVSVSHTPLGVPNGQPF